MSAFSLMALLLGAIRHSEGAIVAHQEKAGGRIMRREAEGFWPFGSLVKEDTNTLETVTETCKHPEPTPKNKWSALKAMAGALASVDAPYNIHGGTLLGLVRGCNIFDSDLDFAVERGWLKNNMKRFVAAAVSFGLVHEDHGLISPWDGPWTFSDLDHAGYETRFRSESALEVDSQQGSEAAMLEASPLPAGMEKLHGRQLEAAMLEAESRSQLEGESRSRLEAAIHARLRANHTTVHLRHGDGIRIDLFTISRMPDHYEWGLWLYNHGVQNVYCPCEVNSTETKVFNWLGVDVKVPLPLTATLTSLYGADFMIPAPWKWDQEPFTIGSCRKPASLTSRWHGDSLADLKRHREKRGRLQSVDFKWHREKRGRLQSASRKAPLTSIRRTLGKFFPRRSRVMK